MDNLEEAASGNPQPPTPMNDRRWFAGMAMQGMLSAMTDSNHRYYAKHPEELLKLPEAAYNLADKMLALDAEPEFVNGVLAREPGPCASQGTSSPC